MIARLLLAAAPLSLAACIDVDILVEIIDADRVEMTGGILAQPFFVDAIDDGTFCEEGWQFDGEVYLCPLENRGSLSDFAPNPDHPGGISITPMGEGRALVSLPSMEGITAQGADFGVDQEAIRLMVAGHGFIMTVQATEIESHTGGTLSPDGTRVTWRIPLIQVLTDDPRLRDPREAVIRY